MIKDQYHFVYQVLSKCSIKNKTLNYFKNKLTFIPRNTCRYKIRNPLTTKLIKRININ